MASAALHKLVQAILALTPEERQWVRAALEPDSGNDEPNGEIQ